MRPQKAVIKETLHIAVGTLVLTAAMVAGFGIAKAFAPEVLYGALFGGLVAIGNFFMLGLTVQSALVGIQGEDAEKAQQAKARMQFSYSVRMLAVFALEVIAISVLKWNALACLCPLLFPRLTILVMNIKKKTDKKEGEQA